MGCKGSKHALHGGCGGGGAWAPEARSYSGLVPRHAVALRSSTLGTLSLDRAAAAAVSFPGEEEGVVVKARKEVGGAGRYWGAAHRGVHGRCPPSPMAPAKRQRQAPRTPTKTPLREPEVINVWELMEGLEDDDGEEDEEEDDDDGHGVERKAQSAPGSPEFDPDVLAVFRKAIDELSPSRDAAGAAAHDGGAILKREIQMLAGVVRARVRAFQQEIDAKLTKKESPPPPLPESARRVVVYLTSLRGIRQTYEDCWATAAVLRSYGVHVDERDLSMHAGFKDELRAALAGAGAGHGRLPQVFADGWHLGGAEEVRRMHESGDLAEALQCCDAAPGADDGKGGCCLPAAACGGCGGVRFVPCDGCSGSCKVFVEDEDGAAGAFRRCPECNENGLVRCPVC